MAVRFFPVSWPRRADKEPVRVMAGIAMGLKCPVCAAEDRADSE